MERKQNESERAYLVDLLRKLPTRGFRYKQAVENFFVLLAVTRLLGVLAWSGIAWITARLAGLQIGWSSEYAIPGVLFVLATSAVYAAYSTTGGMKTWPDHRQPLRDDLSAGKVTE